MRVTAVDLNADLGEIPGDLVLLEVVTSANVACGGHAGDARSMSEAMKAAADHGVRVGAHPSYLDREGFGRVERHEAPEVVARQVAEQVEALASFGAVHYLKLHGALYHRANSDPALAEAILEALAVRHVLAQRGALLSGARERGWGTTEEGFCDRAYRDDGTLVPRGQPGAVLEDEAEVVRQAIHLAPCVGSLCLHGDTPGALAFARRVRAALEEAGVEVRPFT